MFDIANKDAYILKLWYLVYSQIWTNLQMIVTNGYITKLQKEKHCSILYANQGFFFSSCDMENLENFPQII
jgi:hypothetical protein